METYEDFINIDTDEGPEFNAIEIWFNERLLHEADELVLDEEKYRDDFINRGLLYPVTHITYSLPNYNVYIEDIAVDQWAAVSATRSTHDIDNNIYTTVWRAFVQCYVIEHGFMAIYKYVVENFDES